MIVEQVYLHNFLSHENSVINFSTAPLWLICGENGAGKSAVFDAIDFCLYGGHRGGHRKDSEHLVKDGADRGHIEVIVALGGERYRITHHLHRRRGNVGSAIDRWDAQEKWTSLNVGNSAAKIWDWLRPLIPPSDLFRSAIYLRQGATAHFMEGNAVQRIERFGKLIDLRRYAELSDKAKIRAQRLRRKQEDFKSKIDSLGDVSDDAIRAAEMRAGAADSHLKDAERIHKEARTTTASATAWERLTQECARLMKEQTCLRELMRDEKEIRADAALVQRWDRAAATLSTYWERHERAHRLRKEAHEASELASSCRQAVATAERDRSQFTAERFALRGDILPRTRVAADEASQRADDLEHEIQIAATRCAVKTTKRKALVLEARAVAAARDDVDAGTRELEAARTALQDAQSVQEAKQTALRAAEGAIEACEREKVKIEGTIANVTRNVSRLEGQISSHGRIGDTDRECPVCAQRVDDVAHQHLHEVLAEEETTLATLRTQLAAAEEEKDRAAATLERNKSALRAATKTLAQATTAVTRAEERVPQAERRLDAARLDLDSAVKALVESHPEYEAQVAEITHTWIAEHEPALLDGLNRDDLSAATLSQIRTQFVRETATLNTLRSQRRAGVQGIGDSESAESILAEATVARRLASQYGGEIEEHTKRLEDLDGCIKKLDECIATVAVRVTAAEETARKADSDAATDEEHANHLRDCLNRDWKQAFQSKELYEAQCQSIEESRPNAERASELDQAEGQLSQIVSRLKAAIKEQDEIDPSRRIPVTEAMQREDEARDAELTVKGEKTQADAAVSRLKELQQTANAYQQKIAVAEAEANTYIELSELLKVGGPIQVEVAGREQRAIVHEVNIVLGLIHDPLRVQLGRPRRASRVDFQDVVIVDTTNPVGSARYFEYLSGGERFRVALALALALHRRVDGGAAGTLIVDEGFGSLDGDRRDELALQMTDTSNGLLQQRLANNIIISTHSVEVQRHFPYRCLVTKESGTATVQLYEAEDVLVDA